MHEYRYVYTSEDYIYIDWKNDIYAFTTRFKKRSNMVIIFCLSQELVTRGPSRPTGSTYLGDLAGVSISAGRCGEFLRPQKIGIKKKGSRHVPRWMTYFFFPKIRQF